MICSRPLVGDFFIEYRLSDENKRLRVLVPSLGISLFNGGRDDEYRDGISSRPLSGDSFI